MTLLALAGGTFAAGFALVVLGLYAVATARGCLPWRLGVHVVIVAGTQIALTVLSVVTLAQVPEVATAQPWRPAVSAVVYVLLSISLVLVLAHVRERVSSTCTRGHDDYWHGA